MVPVEGSVDAADHVEEGAARSGGADDDGDFAFTDLEVDVLKDGTETSPSDRSCRRCGSVRMGVAAVAGVGRWPRSCGARSAGGRGRVRIEDSGFREGQRPAGPGRRCTIGLSERRDPSPHSFHEPGLDWTPDQWADAHRSPLLAKRALSC